MNTKSFVVPFAFMLALVCLGIPAQAGQVNSKGFTAPKFNGSTADSDRKTPVGTRPPIGFTQQGKASFYGGYWNGRKTANGEIYNQMSMTAAHKTLPFNSQVLVRNLTNNKEVVVRINNRGPYVSGRIIDLSVAAANKLDMRTAGIAQVEIRVIQ